MARSNFKTLYDVDLVLAFNKGEVLMPVRNLIGEKAMYMFADMHLLHLLNINSKKGVVPFNIEFKRFLNEQTDISIRKIEYVVKRLVNDEMIEKNGREYSLTKKFTSLFDSKKVNKDELPWKDQPNYR